jgi:GR25 family glycosyltransferase involved in LPS biosynthesis
MNIAYIFFGQIKNFDEKQFRAFDENVGKKLGSHSVDYFLVTSKNKKYHSQRQSLSEGGEQEIDCHSIEKYFNFKSIFYDEIDSRDNTDIDSLAQDLVENFGEAWGDNSLESTKNSLRQLYSLEFFYEQFYKIGGSYDAFILSRSDLFHTHTLSDQCLNTEGDIFIPFYDNFPQIDYGWFGGVNDRFAVIKNESTLRTYCTRYSSIKNNPQFYHAEKYLKHRLNQEKVDIRKIHNFEFRLIRANGIITDLIGIYPHKEMNCNLKNISKSFFINLERRKDRLAHILSSLPFFAERFDAVDSQSIQLNEEVKMLFPKTWGRRTKAEICCAISHYRLWKKLLIDKDAENYLILEDDVVFKPGFEGFWNNIYSNHIPDSALLIYLGGCQPWNKPRYHEVLEKHNDYFYRVKKNDFFTQGDHFWHMNANSYILSKEGAGLLCQWVEQSGMDEAADNFMQQFLNSNILFSAAHRIFHMNPLMSYQLHEEGDNPEPDKNSDLRFAKEKFTSIHNLEDFDSVERSKNTVHRFNPSSISFDEKKYTIARGENYKNSPPPRGSFNGESTYWLKEDSGEYMQLKFDIKGRKFDSYIKKDVNGDYEFPEDIRFIHGTAKIKNGDVVALATCTVLNKIICDDECKTAMLDFSSGYCVVNLSKLEISGVKKFDPSSQTSTNKNWMCFKYQDLFYVICSIHPLVYATASKLEDISFANVDLNQSIQLRNSCNPVNVGLNKFRMLCHQRSGEYEYHFHEISFEIQDNAIVVQERKKIKTENEKSYCCSLEKEGDDIFVLSGVHDRYCSRFKLIYEEFSESTARKSIIFTRKDLFEHDFICEMFDDYNIIYNEDMNIVEKDSVIVYSDIYAKNINLYPVHMQAKIKETKQKQKEYFDKLKNKNCTLVHLSDEHCHADIDHYENFKHVYRQYYRADAVADNVTFIPLGYKNNFKNE